MSTAPPQPLAEPCPLDHTQPKRAAYILAYPEWPLTINGPTETIDS